MHVHRRHRRVTDDEYMLISCCTQYTANYVHQNEINYRLDRSIILFACVCVSASLLYRSQSIVCWVLFVFRLIHLHLSTAQLYKSMASEVLYHFSQDFDQNLYFNFIPDPSIFLHLFYHLMCVALPIGFSSHVLRSFCFFFFSSVAKWISEHETKQKRSPRNKNNSKESERRNGTELCAHGSRWRRSRFLQTGKLCNGRGVPSRIDTAGMLAYVEQRKFPLLLNGQNACGSQACQNIKLVKLKITSTF